MVISVSVLRDRCLRVLQIHLLDENSIDADVLPKWGLLDAKFAFLTTHCCRIPLAFMLMEVAAEAKHCNVSPAFITIPASSGET